ncbi:MAG: prepilin-type N-terminal cleavage/methylation domain-containing protein [Candidatus Omnitrophica bacterium]|nr:prepilin-type N-terminal cleavage/methylation domain-containing protein [Candidatus Omnitrophota bacterium]MDD5655201.1 prepilin-type N-terminal cleavage/methylation domain-containing protein [Candidatus Omnitrophota bacterium]
MSSKTEKRQGSLRTLPFFINLKGFTLAEIITVVLIMSMLMGITMFSISLIFTRQLDGDTRKLLSDICWAREMTLSRHNDHTVAINTTAESYTITDSAGTVVRPAQVLKVNISSAPATITFQAPSGSALLNPAGSTLITLTKEGRQKQIGIRVETGYVKIE